MKSTVVIYANPPRLRPWGDKVAITGWLPAYIHETYRGARRNGMTPFDARRYTIGVMVLTGRDVRLHGTVAA